MRLDGTRAMTDLRRSDDVKFPAICGCGGDPGVDAESEWE